MVDLPRRAGPVAILHEVLRQGDRVGHRGTPSLVVVIDAGFVGGDAGHQGGSRWVARGRGGVSVGEQGRLAREAREVGSFCLWVAAKRLNPIVEVVEGYEKDVGVFGCGGGNAEQRQHEK